MKFLYGLLAGVLIVTVSVLWTTTATAYPMYNGAPSCDDCHPGFIGGFGGPLHQMHLTIAFDCVMCHNAIGDNPPLSNCAGCHMGDGLQLHHTNAGAPPDQNGLFCATCHPSPAPPPENVAPPYYLTASSAVKDPCSSFPPPGEDADGDGQGLDNDGDLLYDEQDPDCALATEPSTWGRIKALYGK